MLSTDPVDLPIDPVTGDLAFVNGRLVFTTGVPAVIQGARIRMLKIRGEDFLDLDDGVPYFERDGVDASEALLGQKFNVGKATRAFAEQLDVTPGVVAVSALDVKFDGKTRGLSVNWRALTEFGDTAADSLAKGS